MTFAKRLSEARRIRGLTQAELAARAGFQPAAICHFEAGRRTPTTDNLAKLVNALGMSADYLIGVHVSPMTVGGSAHSIVKAAAKMSASDLDSLVRFAHMLADKPRRKAAGCTGE